MEEDAAEQEMQRPIKRPAEDDVDGSESDAKRPKPPPSPTKWWEDKATALLIGVREEQATLYDPKRRGFHCCRGFERYVCEPAVCFDHEEESTARIARPLDTIPDSELDHLKLALNVIHVKVLASDDVGFPVRVFGTVLMRDELDFKCIYLFQRDRDNCQVISSPVSVNPSSSMARSSKMVRTTRKGIRLTFYFAACMQGEMLALTGPNRGPFDATPFYFEINLKIRDQEQTMDRIFSRSLINEDYPLDQWTKKQEVSSWLSTLEFAYRSVHYAVEATVGINILRGPRKFYGSLVACTSEDSSEMVLYDSERWGAVAIDAADGSVPLTRPLVVLREDEDLVLKVRSFGRGRRAKPKTNVLTVEHCDGALY
ncbi:unnamed protein product [Urochloa decumbens]|uniref:DUF6598 domain-containing protein n=1 Tax=Urochloa decumbens TaxID=240449 RepID=A0ABC8WZU1_9POAL